MSDKIIHKGETMLVSIEAEDFPVTDLSDVVLTIKHGQTEQQLHLEDFTLVTNPDTEIRDNVHPTVSGYQKMGLEVVNQINCWQAGVQGGDHMSDIIHGTTQFFIVDFEGSGVDVVNIIKAILII